MAYSWTSSDAFVTHYPDEAYLNQVQSPLLQIGTYKTRDDKNRAAVMARGPNTSLGYQHGINFVNYEYSPMGTQNSAARMYGYVAAEPTYVNDRPIGHRPPRPHWK